MQCSAHRVQGRSTSSRRPIAVAIVEGLDMAADEQSGQERLAAASPPALRHNGCRHAVGRQRGEGEQGADGALATVGERHEQGQASRFARRREAGCSSGLGGEMAGRALAGAVEVAGERRHGRREGVVAPGPPGTTGAQAPGKPQHERGRAGVVRGRERRALVAAGLPLLGDDTDEAIAGVVDLPPPPGRTTGLKGADYRIAIGKFHGGLAVCNVAYWNDV